MHKISLDYVEFIIIKSCVLTYCTAKEFILAVINIKIKFNSTIQKSRDFYFLFDFQACLCVNP
jgi:hypothetical protein